MNHNNIVAKMQLELFKVIFISLILMYSLKRCFVYQCCLFAIINPPLSGKVGGLSTVEAMVKTSMISKWERHDELPSLLSDLNNKTTHNNNYIIFTI